MTETKKIEIKNFDYYIVFMDSNQKYIMAYGYDHIPSILEMKCAIETLSLDKDIALNIPNLEEVLDYICFYVMVYDEFITYMDNQYDRDKK